MDCVTRARPELMAGFQVTAYRDLITATCAQLILFNRRRGGEAAQMEVAQYQKPISGPVNEVCFITISLPLLFQGRPHDFNVGGV